MLQIVPRPSFLTRWNHFTIRKQIHFDQLEKMNFSHLIGHLEFVFRLVKKKSLIGAEEP